MSALVESGGGGGGEITLRARRYITLSPTRDSAELRVFTRIWTTDII